MGDRLTDTEWFRDKGKLALRADFYTQLSKLDNGARLLAFLVALLRFALGSVDNGNTSQMLFIAAGTGLDALLFGRHRIFLDC
jgi:hypothetical protein